MNATIIISNNTRRHTLLVFTITLLLWINIATAFTLTFSRPAINYSKKRSNNSLQSIAEQQQLQDTTVAVPTCLPHQAQLQLHTVNGLTCREVHIDLNHIGIVTILEATAEAQEHLVNLALGEEIELLNAAENNAGTTNRHNLTVKHDDPYGSVLWPAASAIANHLIQLHLSNDDENQHFDLTKQSVLEVGAGTGLVSIAAGVAGCREILATDYEEVPLTLLEYAVENLNPNLNLDSPTKTSIKINTKLFDICDFDTPLPKADVVVAADIMYEPLTGKAMAKRVYEALQRGSRVLVGDSPGRAGRPAFLEELRRLLGDDEESIDFVDAVGTTCSGPRHDLICGKGSTSVSDVPKMLEVAVLDLQGPILTL